jgi:hypothetical protein
VSWRVEDKKCITNNLNERPRRRWENNIKMDLKEIRCEGIVLNSVGSG